MQLGFWTFARENPSKLAVIDPDGTRHTAGEVLASANRIAHGLRARGLVPGDCIAVALPNSVEVLEVFMAAAQCGWYVTPINWHLTATEIAYIMKDCGAKAIVCSSLLADTSVEAADMAAVPASARYCVGAIPGFQPLSVLEAGQSSEPPSDRCAGGAMTYTSGTTGNPKGVRRKVAHADPETIASQQAMFLALFGIMPGSEGVHLVGAPLYHTAVITFSTNHMHLGHTVVLMDKWTPESMLQLIAEHKVTNSHMVPTQFNRLLKLPDETKQKYDVSSLTHVIHSAAPCPVDTKYKMLDWWGPCIYEYYAASEGGGTLATPTQWLAKPGTVGTPWPISQIRILDDEHQPCDASSVGTVWIRMGDHKFEYHKDDEKTGDAWRDGFFTVGDAGYLDDDGYLFLCDRKADMIISGGVNIYPAEIESVFITHAKVADVAIFGVPDDDWGEQVKAVIQPAAGIEASEALAAELDAFAREKLAKYKMPRTMDFIVEMPRDPNGKLYKRKLRDPYWQGRDRAI